MSKSEFLSILAIHREQIKDYHQSPGWNRWALIGGLASLIWLSMDLYQNDLLNFGDSILILFALLWIEPSSRVLFYVFGYSSEKNSNTYLKLSNELNNNVFSISFALATYIGSILLLNLHFDIVSWKLGILNGYVIVLLILAIIMVIAARIDLTIPEDVSKNRITKLTRNIAAFIYILVSALAIWVVLENVNDFQNVTVVRSALLFFGIYYIGKRILISFEDTSLLDSIDYLIEDVSFEKLSVEEGQNQLRLILLGSEFKDLIAPFAADFIQNSNKYIAFMEFAKIRARQYHSTTVESEKWQFENDVQRTMRGVTHFENELIKAGKKLQVKLYRFQPFESDEENYMSVWNQFKTEQNKILKKRDELKSLLAGINWQGTKQV